MFNSETTKTLTEAALEVWNSFDETGCDNCGVVGRPEMKKLVEALIDVGALKVENNQPVWMIVCDSETPEDQKE